MFSHDVSPAIQIAINLLSCFWIAGINASGIYLSVSPTLQPRCMLLSDWYFSSILPTVVTTEEDDDKTKRSTTAGKSHILVSRVFSARIVGPVISPFWYCIIVLEIYWQDYSERLVRLAGSQNSRVLKEYSAAFLRYWIFVNIFDLWICLILCCSFASLKVKKSKIFMELFDLAKDQKRAPSWFTVENKHPFSTF